MSKKNKNKKNRQVDYFNMSPEEQKANAEIFHDLEQGEASILDVLNYKVKSAPVAQSDYKRQIAEACFGICDIENNHNIEVDADNAYISEVDSVICGHVASTTSDIEDNKVNGDIECAPYTPTTTIVEDTVEVKETVTTTVIPEPEENVEDEAYDASENTTESLNDNIARIHFRYDSIIGKMFIEDGLVSTPVSVYYSSSIELDPDMIPDDADAFGQLLSKIVYFIITCKHPAVIMSEETFNIEFGMFSKLNHDRFVFFKNNGFVYVYVIEEGESDNFYCVADILKMDSDALLRFVVCAAYAANTIHNTFMHDDEDEVENVMDLRHSIKELLKLIESDPATEYAGHQAAGDVMKRMKVNDLSSFVSDARRLIDDLLIEDEDEDDDEYDNDETDNDDSDDDDDDIDVTDFPDVDLMTDTDDIDAMIESVEPSESITSKVETTVTHKTTTVESSDRSDNMTVSVHHRNRK